MSTTTETFHVRGVRSDRIRAALDACFEARGFTRVAPLDRARVERTVPDLARLIVRRRGAWTSIADARGEDLDTWGKQLSAALARSVLTIWTWDGEASVIVSRWKRGKQRGKLELLSDVTREAGGPPMAPVDVLWPWLPKDRRDAFLRDGIPLVVPASTTGDKELDTLLEDFDEVDDDPASTFVPIETSVAAIGATIGLREPFVEPWAPLEGDEELVYQPRAKRG